MTEKKPTWEERCPEFEISLINQPIDYSVQEEPIEVKETAEQRARRRWRMEEPSE
jgi:hypothetical protein